MRIDGEVDAISVPEFSIELPLMFTEKTLGVNSLEDIRGTVWMEVDEGIDFTRLYENWNYYTSGRGKAKIRD